MVTEYAITPYRPTAASSSARAPNAPRSVAPIRVGVVVVAATSAAGTSSVKTISGSIARMAERSIGSALSAGVVVRTARATVREGRAGKWRYGRGSSPTDRTLWSRATPTTWCGASSNPLV
jgi:hypothetical protein